MSPAFLLVLAALISVPSTAQGDAPGRAEEITATTSAHGDHPARLKGMKSGKWASCFSDSARRNGPEGGVTVDVRIESDGSVSEVIVPSGTPTWQEDAARCLVSRFNFEPALKNGVPVAGDVAVPLNFEVEGRATAAYAKPASTADELEEALRACYPPDSLSVATALYDVTVDENGEAVKVELRSSTGDKHLDNAGDCMVRKIHFTPMKRGSAAVSSVVTLPLNLRPPK